MDYSKKQQELDLAKWFDSSSKNYDTCGEYSYCSKCNKSREFPCAYAYEAYTTTSKTTTKKPSTSKSTSYKTSTPKTSLKTSKSKTTTTSRTTSKKVAA